MEFKNEVVTDGFEELSKELEELASNVDDDKALDAIQEGVDQFVSDIRALPKPRSKLGGTHTHMLDSVGSERDKSVINVGWGKYYGKIVENGHHSRKGHWVAAQPHMKPTFEKNKDKYYQAMVKALQLDQ